MFQKMYKGRFGWTESDEKHPSTHILLPEEEFRALLRSEQESSRKKNEAEKRAEEQIKAIRKDADQKLQEAKKNLQIEKNEFEEEAVKKIMAAEAEAKFQTSLNENLLRICKERANADRKLKPKKEHTGYVVISSQEKEIRYQEKRKMITAVVWETVFQSPYSIEFTEEQARKLIVSELLSNEGGWKLGAVGINSRFMIDYGKLVEKCPENIKTKNTAFNERLKANFKAGYWEYIVLHTLPLGAVPKDMLP